VIRVWTLIAANKGTARRIANYVSYMMSATLRCLLLRRPDVVIATSPQFFCGWAGVLTKWWFRMSRPFGKRPKFVLEIRDIWPESIGAVDAIGNPLALRILEWMELRMYKAANHVVTVGPGYKRRLKERGVPEEKLSIVMNGVDRDLLGVTIPDRAELRNELGIGDEFICSYIGTIGMACGLEVLIRAGEKLRDQQREDILFLVIGDGAVRRELEQEANDKGLKNVRFLGRQAKESIPGLLALTDACLVHLRKTPLFETVMPSKIFEAAGMRRPILNGVNGDARELIERAEAGLVFEPEDEDGLIEAVCRLADHPELAKTLGDNGFDYVMDHFDRDQLAKDYEGILERLGGR
jgi:glycosyltransferase involved in cell wall biosynthesis